MTDPKHSQRLKILAGLKKARSSGMTNVELNLICFRYGARIFELRRKGWRIKTQNLGCGLFVYRLHAADW